MSKTGKLALAISCFLPLFLILGIESFFAARCLYVPVENQNLLKGLVHQSEHFKFNVSLFLIWFLLFWIGVSGIVYFCKRFLKAEQLSKETVIITKAENITPDYYFTYFSLFVISFFSIDPTKDKDFLIFAFLMVLIVWVYVANDMYFVNPVLNIMGYKSFTIVYYKYSHGKDQKEKEQQKFEIKVFSRKPLNRMIGEKFFVTFSPHDFSVCNPVSKRSE